ncbi:hypothetical protein PC9H_010399 [Pleurotus ostreatus]|uniref:Uncharacterized protein n=2 Tax=Pleurotus TaxID=5320 RepID=A0A8H6ZPF5_PLEOS|nr:uncharacterized protein PC9H_010399 [Pleurotus ostreatus]KAF7422243.1 hypothetical protein PC9H_010399 [Pleurotus ostreatus]KAG9227815.1 hypothetical protein CCMSSC00406_0008637 [Pleurotus cornucopiae]KAJ8691960.1 hypothetical protein PTI98_011476 [Pleurotus ostreatus]
MAPLNKRALDNTNNDERRRREEKRRREDESVAEADARLEKEARRRRREKQRARKAAEEARVRAAVSEYIAARARMDENEDDAAEEAISAAAGSSTGAGKERRRVPRATKGKSPRGRCGRSLASGACNATSSVVRAWARTCWECKVQHVRCGNGAGGVRGTAREAPPAVTAEPTVASSLGDLAAQVFDMSVHVLERSQALSRLEERLGEVANTVAWIAGAMGAPPDVAERVRGKEGVRTKSPQAVGSTSAEGTEDAEGEMEVDDAKAPSTSDTDDVQDAEPADTTDEEEEGMAWEGTGKVLSSDDEEDSE